MGLKTHKQTFRNLRTIQHVLSIGRTEVFMCGKSGSTRNGHRKSIKIGKYYIYGT
jgi:hypothetical protein